MKPKPVLVIVAVFTLLIVVGRHFLSTKQIETEPPKASASKAKPPPQTPSTQVPASQDRLVPQEPEFILSHGEALIKVTGGTINRDPSSGKVTVTNCRQIEFADGTITKALRSDGILTLDPNSQAVNFESMDSQTIPGPLAALPKNK